MLLLVITVKVLFFIAIYTFITVLGMRTLEKYGVGCYKKEGDMCNPFMFASTQKEETTSDMPNTTNLQLGVTHADFDYLRSSRIESFNHTKMIHNVMKMEKEVAAYIEEGDISSQFLLHRDINDEMLRIIKEDAQAIKKSNNNPNNISIVSRTKLDKAFKEYTAILTELYNDIQNHSKEVSESYLKEHKDFIEEYARLREEREKEQEEFYEKIKSATDDALNTNDDEEVTVEVEQELNIEKENENEKDNEKVSTETEEVNEKK